MMRSTLCLPGLTTAARLMQCSGSSPSRQVISTGISCLATVLPRAVQVTCCAQQHARASNCLTSRQPLLGKLTEQGRITAGGDYDPGLLEQPFSLKPREAASFIVRSVGKVVTGAVAPLSATKLSHSVTLSVRGADFLPLSFAFSHPLCSTSRTWTKASPACTCPTQFPKEPAQTLGDKRSLSQMPPA